MVKMFICNLRFLFKLFKDCFCEVLVDDQAACDCVVSVASIETSGGNSRGRATLVVFFTCFVCVLILYVLRVFE